MKKIFLLLAITSLSVSCMNKYEDSLQELGERVDKLEQKIPTIDQQIESIKESIVQLEEVDKALKAKDEELAAEDANFPQLIEGLVQYVNSEINSAESWAEATFCTLKQYNSAVSSLAKLESNIAAGKTTTSQELNKAVSDLRTSFQKWVGEQLSGYYTIAKADAEFAALRQSAENGDEKLQGEIDNLETEITKSAIDLTEAYQKAIEEAINDHNGVITAALNEELEEVNKRLDEELATINAKLAALEAQISKNAEEIAKLLARIQSISYIHKYADGKATMLQNSSMYSTSLSFEVSPKDVAAPLAKVWKDVVSAKAVCSGADEASFVALPIQSLTADEENGIISVSISGTSLPENVIGSQQEVKIAISISNGIDDITSDYIPAVVKSISEKAICYTSVDGNIIEPQTSAFDANIVSNTYDEGIGIIVFDAPVTSIGMTAFEGCSSLTSITIPDSVTEIEFSAFENCSSLTSVTIGNGVTKIVLAAFSGCSSLTSVTIPDSVTSIGGYAFSGCSSLTSVTIGNGVTVIGSSAFSGCSSLTSVTIGDSVTEIGSFAFENCSSLTSVTIGDSVTEIGGYAFHGCSSLTSFYGKFASGDNRCLIVDGVLNSFAPAKLTSYTIPDNVTKIGWYAFSGCSSLTSVTIPDSVTEIGSFAFENCSSLTSITIPDSVTSIGSETFEGCTSLKSFTSMSATPNSNIYIPDSVTSIYVYDEFVDVYKQQWPDWADKIIPMGSCDSETIIYYDNGGKRLNLQWNGAVVKEHIPGKLVLFGRVYSLERAFANQTSLISVTIPDSVTEIGDYAFEGCSSLTSVTIPDSVTSIGDYAFEGCSSLTSITIPDSVTSIGKHAFEGCTSLKSVTIPDSVTSIGYSTFEGCSSLTSVTIGNSVTSIGKDAFYGCSSLTSVDISDLSAWCKIYFSNLSANPLYYAKKLCLNGSEITDLTIPSGITDIKAYAFYDCDGLTSVTIPDSVTSIWKYAFYDCDGLTSVNIPDSVTSIGDRAFSGCSSLTSVTIPDSVTSIGDYAFEGCSSLTSITIPDSVTSIGDSAFSGCSSLTSVYISDLSAWCKIAFGSSNASPLSGGANLYLNGSKLTDITIPSEITAIKNYTFSGCSSLTSITIPDSVTSIGNSAFYGCTGELIINNKIIETNYTYSNYPSYNDNGWLYGAGFTKLTIGGNITKIGNYTFYGCSSLTSVTIPDSVTEIGGYAFFKCESLADVYCLAVRPPKGSTRMFDTNAPNRRIYVPAELCSAYKVYEYWSSYSNDIYPLNIAYDEIWYTSNDGAIVKPNSAVAFDANIISNTYKNGIGLIKFDKDITSIGANAFKNCTSLKSVTIPDSVTSIGSEAFNKCSNLTFVTIPDSVTSIGYRAFECCSSLTSATIGNGVTEIGSFAFSNCSSLTSVYISDLSAWCKIAFGSGDAYNLFSDIYANPLYQGANLYLNGSKLTDITIPSEITAIKNYTFSGCSSLTSVTIPDCVTSIGEKAFNECSSLTSVTIGNGVTSIGEKAFDECSSLTSVTIGDSVTSIGYCAFADCSSLTSVTIPDSVTSIGKEAFTGCSSLTSITIGNGVTEIGKYTFHNCSSLTSITIPDSVTEIEMYAFQNCSSLTSVTIGNGVTSIGTYAFKDCSSLTSVTIGNGVTSIGENVFSDCRYLTRVYISDLSAWCKIAFGSSSANPLSYGANLYLDGSKLTDITIPDGVTSIGDYTFYNCKGLTSVTIPDSVTSIGEDAFYHCSYLTSVYISDLSAWCKIAFGNGGANPLYRGVSIYTGRGADLYLNGSKLTDITIPSEITAIKNYTFSYCTSLTSVTIPDSVTEIGFGAFCKCSSLTSVTIPDSVTSIGGSAFSGCSSLTSVTIPDRVTSIGANAFYECRSLTSVTIGNGVTSIGEKAFYYSGLTEVYCKATTPPIVYDYAFANTSTNLKFYVPIESVEAYKAAQYWSGRYIYGYYF